VAVTSEDVVKHFRALADCYEEAAQELKISELRAFLIHEATWLRNVQPAGDPAELLDLRVKQAAEYLASIRTLRRRQGGKSSGTIRIMT
jgi:hypothetical protein